MADDSQAAFWRIAGQNYDALEQRAPEGFTPIVDVYVDGSTSPIPTSVVQTREKHDWVVLQSLNEGSEDPELHAGNLFVLIHSNRIARVELRFVRDDGRGLGFSVTACDD
ncbi:MAG: hypothetical protein H0U46_10540 [Actinobacteria bacterium]|nr:hypothetical protein [Actinomycetota bacterium]